MSADIAAHYAALVALIPSGALAVYKGAAPDNPTYPYAVVWGEGGTEDSDSLADDPSTLTARAYVTVSGLSFDSAAAALKITRTALNRARPAVAGRSLWPLHQKSQQPIQADLSIGVPGFGHPFYAVDQYDLVNNPA